jgi:hypothetical protein
VARVDGSRATLAKATLRAPFLLEGWKLRMRLVRKIARSLGVEVSEQVGDTLDKPRAFGYGVGGCRR